MIGCSRILERRIPERSLLSIPSARHAIRNTLIFAVGLGFIHSSCCATAQTSKQVGNSTPLVDAPQPASVNAQSQARSVPDSRLRLSLQDAIRMALERNLDIQIEQVDQIVANESVARGAGGSTPRAINYNIREVPASEAIPALSLLASTASILSPTGVDPTGVAVSSSYDIGHVLELQHSLSIAPTPFSAGAPVPAFDLYLQGQFAWFRRDASIPSEAPVATPGTSSAANTTTSNTLGNVNLLKAFSSGASIQLGINDFTQTFYSAGSSAIPFTHPNASAVVSQPLLRGAGRSNNTRFIAIAKTNKTISAAILEQQMISTVSGIENLYYDLISLQDSVAVQDRALKAANILLSDDKEQLRVGRMPPIEVTRALALVSASQLALTQTEALRQQQGNILLSVVDPQALLDTTGQLNGIFATDELSPPLDDPQPSIADLIGHAWATRPDLRQAALQIENGELAVGASANARLPEIDLYGEFQTRGSIISNILPLGGNTLYAAPTLVPVPAGGPRSAQVYELGIQFNLPLQNRVARADLGADRAILQEQRLRVTQIRTQVAAEVRNALVGMSAAKEAAHAAAASRKLQEELLGAETEKFQAGMSTNFAVVEQQTYLAQAETTEVATRAAWKKAVVQLARALGDTLQRSGIELAPKGSKAQQTP